MAWPWDWFDALGSELEAIIGLPWAIADILMQILYVTYYPFILVVNALINVVNNLVFPFITFIQNILSLGGNIAEMANVFSGTFPSEWTFMFGAIVTINIALRIYRMIPLIGRG